MAPQREVAKNGSAHDADEVEAKREDPSNARFSGEGKLPGVAATDQAKQAKVKSASEQAFDDEADKVEEFEMKAMYIDRPKRFSIDVDQKSGKAYLGIPVQNQMVEYIEWYALDKETYEKFMANPALSYPMVEQARSGKLDHLLLVKPGSDRGMPI